MAAAYADGFYFHFDDSASQEMGVVFQVS